MVTKNRDLFLHGSICFAYLVLFSGVGRGCRRAVNAGALSTLLHHIKTDLMRFEGSKNIHAILSCLREI